MIKYNVGAYNQPAYNKGIIRLQIHAPKNSFPSRCCIRLWQVIKSKVPIHRKTITHNKILQIKSVCSPEVLIGFGRFQVDEKQSVQSILEDSKRKQNETIVSMERKLPLSLLRLMSSTTSRYRISGPCERPV